MASTEPLRTPLADPIVVDLHARVGRLENDIAAVKERDGQINTELAVMQTDIKYIKHTQDSVTKGINRILWSIGLSVLTAATAFILSGGLMVTQ